MIWWSVFRPNITETVDWALNTNYILYLPTYPIQKRKTLIMISNKKKAPQKTPIKIFGCLTAIISEIKKTNTLSIVRNLETTRSFTSMNVLWCLMTGHLQCAWQLHSLRARVTIAGAGQWALKRLCKQKQQTPAEKFSVDYSHYSRARLISHIDRLFPGSELVFAWRKCGSAELSHWSLLRPRDQ